MDRRFQIGDFVKPRPGGAVERHRWLKRDVVGTVVSAADIPANGWRIKVQWPGEEPPDSFEDSELFDPA